MDDNNFEKFPTSAENLGERVIPAEQDFTEAFSDGVPEFAGDSFGKTNENNEVLTPEDSAENTKDYDDGLANATALINYGLNAASRELGVEQTVQLIKNFDATGSDDPVRDLFNHLGINNAKKREDVVFEAAATKPKENEFREESDMPNNPRRSKEGALKAIADMKELISEVEGADPRYAELRAGAESFGIGYFDYAVKNYGSRGLIELFGTLAEQNKKQEEETSSPKPKAENTPPSEEQESIDQEAE